MDDNRIIKTEYSEVMQKSFIDYAMSVIIARALPDVRDGLKPVQVSFDIAEVAVSIDERESFLKILRHNNERLIDGTVIIRLIS